MLLNPVRVVAGPRRDAALSVMVEQFVAFPGSERFVLVKEDRNISAGVVLSTKL